MRASRTAWHPRPAQVTSHPRPASLLGLDSSSLSVSESTRCQQRSVTRPRRLRGQPRCRASSAAFSNTRQLQDLHKRVSRQSGTRASEATRTA
ncbi:hypothetical protein A0H81_08521 [Grifola frondosa]|uniref:Uncharacterized protein n=1 Tax=Grifola frondosa TaxID=5627 RepID=A0A1C7M3I8_GRIFR|nr:hypothetical protein A0H81_08521 [Grifola frondosa]